jgi:DtxR family Mn-dependent transcriptional regulator
VLRYLQDRNILPGSEITLLEAAPLQGPLTIKVGGKEVALGLQIADFVLVRLQTSRK